MEKNRLKVVVRGCHNLAAYRELVESNPNNWPVGAVLGLLPCSSKVEPQLVLKIFEQGADGALILACPFGACRFVEGNYRAEKRVAYAAGWLEELGLEPARVKFVSVDADQAKNVAGLIQEFCSTVAELGPTMVKGRSRAS